ncbi:YktB family protein [Aureibacillus halotolerans]|uniref:UPF0637 protein EV213_102299 n=1 Tax=Aureibacillus halotolerans TaxID=1508390 RepID=A0A4R6U6X6_9BACI|nr:DUF1054 domain-containing protein [Aureibacillus halotolerans]TDQ42268.1 uncharacterized protein YktB (UPF0637 family) [Aureibacillus halotolerans]
MSFQGFTAEDFGVFHIQGLEARMIAIKEQIQPKFEVIGQELLSTLSQETDETLHIHIAQHARRTKNPPKDTWLAFSHSARGYKKHPHFQIGLFDDHVFIWLANIYEMPEKAKVAESYLHHLNDIRSLPGHFMVSQDHMQKEARFIQELDDSELLDMLSRFKEVKKAEFLLGLQIPTTDIVLSKGADFITLAKDTFSMLTPFYQTARHAQQK